ncbi:MAG: DUF4398 domain-containing protein [Gammaproteobacteria bacterium]|nr:DUF4398 domain-containing protein [Gammaproteobacteria bacterium]
MIQLRFRYLTLVLGAVLGCTSIPTQEMSDARQAVQAAREANAGELAPEPMENAEALLNKAKQALDAGAYEQAREEALAARREAIKARGEALKSAPAP